MFANYCGYDHIFESDEEDTIVDPALSCAQIRPRGFTDDETKRHRKAYPVSAFISHFGGRPRRSVVSYFPQRGLEKS